jgi:hypothetical protein
MLGNSLVAERVAASQEGLGSKELVTTKNICSGMIISMKHMQTNKNWRVSEERRVPLNALHSVISQKKILFKTTAVKTSNPTNKIPLLVFWTLSIVQFLFKNVSETGFCLCPQVKAYSVGPNRQS